MLGYHHAQSHDLVDVTRCRIARPEVQDALNTLRSWIQPDRCEGLETVEIRSNGHKTVYAFTASNSTPRATREHLATLNHVALNGKTLSGNPTLELDVGGIRLQAGPQVFYQVNLEANALLVESVRSLVQGTDPARVLDLYAGIGNFSLPICRDGSPVLAIEQQGRAITDLQEAARAQDLSAQMETLVMNVKHFDPSRTFFDVAILDPPRSGSGGCLDRLLHNRPRHIVYVSCNIVGGAAEILRTAKAGYSIQSVRCFEMFPETRHFETLVHLSRDRM